MATEWSVGNYHARKMSPAEVEAMFRIARAGEDWELLREAMGQEEAERITMLMGGPVALPWCEHFYLRATAELAKRRRSKRWGWVFLGFLAMPLLVTQAWLGWSWDGLAAGAAVIAACVAHGWSSRRTRYPAEQERELALQAAVRTLSDMKHDPNTMLIWTLRAEREGVELPWAMKGPRMARVVVA